jgi:acetyl-CoA C-acetyltransferase
MGTGGREVYIAGVGLTKVDLTGRVFGNVLDLFADAYGRALETSTIKRFDAVQVGIMSAEVFEQRANIAAKIADRLGLTGVPAVRVETASSTGSAAFHEACYKIRSGAAEHVLVVAGERMKTVTTREATQIMSQTIDPVERRFGFTMPALIALLSQVFFREIGLRSHEIPDVLSRLMHRAHALGSENPLAAFWERPEPLASYFDRERNLPVALPLCRKDCSPICDGAAAIVLTAQPQAVRVAGLGSATDTSSLLDRAELSRLPATRRAAAFAYHEAGVREPAALEGLVCEVHDAFNSLLPINLCDLGLLAPDAVIDALIGPARYGEPAVDPFTNPRTGPSGRLAVNPSGGLKARGHPVGGTGLFQIGELYLQLTGAFPSPRAQVPDARLGLAHSIGGPGNNVYVTLLELAANRRERAHCGAPPARLQHTRRSVRVPPEDLHGRSARVEAATTIYVTGDDSEPKHVALLSVGDRRVFARLAAPIEAGDAAPALQGKRARLLAKDDGDQYFELVRERWDVSGLARAVFDQVLRRS